MEVNTLQQLLTCYDFFKLLKSLSWTVA